MNNDDPIMQSAAINIEDTYWSALARRDRQADGRFVYAVSTTGVYCRPSCAARAANPRNVTFYATCAEAERAGYRPCKRCRPNEASQAERHAAAVAQACRLIEQSETPPSLDALSRMAGISPHHFHRLFKRATGITPKAYAEADRAKRFATALPGAGAVTDAVYAAGYNSSSRFYASANARLGMTPTAYRKGGAGVDIRFAIGHCALGSILVAATAKGVCAILLGDDPDALARHLRDRFPKAHIEAGDAAFETLVAQVIGFVESPGLDFGLPLDIGGTAFQQRVWQALRTIPAGSTATYAEIARATGNPAAVRAVASACAANALAVAIPCHRVVRTDGALSGYRWGVERKRDLLRREGVLPDTEQ